MSIFPSYSPPTSPGAQLCGSRSSSLGWGHPENAGTITLGSPSFSSCLLCLAGSRDLHGWTTGRGLLVCPVMSKPWLYSSLFGKYLRWAVTGNLGCGASALMWAESKMLWGVLGCFPEPLGRGQWWWHHNPGHQGELSVKRKVERGCPGGVSRGTFWLPAINPQIKQLSYT